MYLETCIKRYGRVFCWDSEAQKVIEVTPKELDADQCPNDVLLDLLRLVGVKDSGVSR